jgi:FkbH-like protein
MSTTETMERVLSRRLRALAVADRMHLARETLEQLDTRFAPDVCRLLLDHLNGIESAALNGWLETLPATPNGMWLRTQLLSDDTALAAAWERFFSFRVARKPEDRLSWARALAGSGAQQRALHQLRLALAAGAEYPLFTRAARLVRELAQAPNSSLRQCKIAVLGTSTTSLFVPVLQALCLRDQIDARLYEAPYGSVEQEIRSGSSGLAKFRPDVVLFLMHWRDLRLDAVTADVELWLDRYLQERKADWKRLSELCSCHIIQPSFDHPAADAYGSLSGILPGGRISVIDLLNLRLRKEAPPNVSIVDIGNVQRELGTSRWQNEQEWCRYRQHPATDALPALAEAHMSHLRPVLGLSRKVLVTDLDNTLWRGVIGEDGVDGIAIGPGSAEGEAHAQLQHYMLELKQRGILLAVCSKNNPEDAQSPFKRHPQMSLKLSDFAAFRANWDDKGANLRALAGELSLGLDSFVFLDDNPVEREWVRSQLPEVAVVELGNSPFDFVRRLDSGRYFEALTLSAEDLARAEQYQKQAQREQLRVSAASLEDFLRDLQLEASVEAISEQNIRRVAQLVNKTNQFNLTTRRYTEAQIRALAYDASAWTAVFRLSDRMDDYGLIGALFCRAAPDGERSEIDTWLMSCRALGRQMERFMFDRMVEAAAMRGIKQIVGVYRPTGKNVLVKELYDQLGFRRLDEHDEETRYVLEIPARVTPTATHIRNVSLPRQPGES